MSTPLRSIPPLIPLPDNTPTPAPSINDKDDLFSTLFSPATPPASPTLKPAPDAHAPAPAPARTRHARNASAASVDFGSFVSVPAAEAPLQPARASSPAAPLTPFASAFFDRFAEDARVATERNQRGFLAELLEHEDDPLYWTHHHAEPERAHTPTPTPTPTPSMPPAPAPAQQPHPRPGEPDGCSDLLLLDPDSPSALMPDPAHAQPQAPGHPPRAQNTTTPAHAPAPLPPLANTSPVLRSPSLPPASSPTRPTPPLLTRTQSHTTFSTASLPSRWMSSLLAPRSSPAPVPTPPPPPHLPPAHHASLPAAAAAAIAAAGTGAGPGITHGSPFAVHAYAPPSGAPGFAGDRAWDKGFAFDGPALEKRSVRLAGRRETTDAVLSTELADKIRPHLPPLARLHKAWTLLYSLDQHGISLQTLYARCEAHAGGGGGALVVVRDAGDALFGVWLGDGVRPSKGSYYGSGESFLWRTSAGGERLHVYKWTGKNDYVALCEPEYLSFGGGDGHYGLYLDDTLLDGSSARCPTFANEPLCAPGPHRGGTVAFECVGLEVWAVGPS